MQISAITRTIVGGNRHAEELGTCVSIINRCGRVTLALRKEQWPAGNAAVNATRILYTESIPFIYSEWRLSVNNIGVESQMAGTPAVPFPSSVPCAGQTTICIFSSARVRTAKCPYCIISNVNNITSDSSWYIHTMNSKCIKVNKALFPMQKMFQY